MTKVNTKYLMANETFWIDGKISTIFSMFTNIPVYNSIIFYKNRLNGI